MKNVSALKTNKTESPKTPGGISKSLLTPCRRVGLSRNWKKAGPSPFVSPISGSNSNNVEIKVEKKETRKRKQRVVEAEEESEETPEKPVESDDIDETEIPPINENEDIVGTPSRHVELPRKKKSKLLTAISKSKDISSTKIHKDLEEISSKHDDKDEYAHVKEHSIEATEAAVATPIRAKSIIKSHKCSPLKSTSKVIKEDHNLDTNVDVEIKENIAKISNKVDENSRVIENNAVLKPCSPNELTKECIVVLQKKIFKTDKKISKKTVPVIENTNYDIKTKKSQACFDSDIDDVPLSHLNNIVAVDNKKIDPEVITIDEDDDFAETNKVTVKKLEDKKTSTGDLKATKKKANKISLKSKKPAPIKIEAQPSSQSSNSFDDDDDFEFDNKRTILIRKSYDKVTKPLKAKSTGSITQKDIDDLRRRIEMKKKLLLAKAMTEDTEELRGLIKKWQKGCQDALMELMDLMKTKFPEKQNMEYSEMLQMLKIPANLVSYDEENDCFNTPDDATIILSKFIE